jgi:hypothetical protein
MDMIEAMIGWVTRNATGIGTAGSRPGSRPRPGWIVSGRGQHGIEDRPPGDERLLVVARPMTGKEHALGCRAEKHAEDETDGDTEAVHRCLLIAIPWF